MPIHEYEDYAEYKEAQIRSNLKKLDAVWVKETTIEFISNHILKKRLIIESGICHGTRGGKEQEWFRKYLNADVIGTEISHTATQFPHTIEWDFHDVKREWIGAFDFVYSNSWDHSYDPRRALASWMECVKPGGYVVLNLPLEYQKSKKSDPFGGTLGEFIDLIIKMGFNLESLVRSPEGDADENRRAGWTLFIVKEDTY